MKKHRIRRALESVTALTLSILAFGGWAAQGVFAATDVADQPDTPVIVGLSLTQVVVAAIMTGVGYLINFLLPFLKTDAQKGFATLVYQALGVVIVQVASNSTFGWNQETLVAFVTAMGTWLVAHKVLWSFGWAPKLGAGRNVGDPPA